MSIPTGFIPQFSHNVIENFIEEHAELCHPGVFLFRVFYWKDKTKKKEVLNRIAKTMIALDSCVLLNRQTEHLIALRSKGYTVCQWRQTTISRLACGLGIPSLSNNGLFLDRVHGIPYLSGSALKGISQDQALIEMDAFSETLARQNKKRLEKNFVAIFGAQSAEQGESLDPYWQARKGHVIFLDAIPVLNAGAMLFEVDIINPHYKDYYKGKGEPPADYYSPDPNFFLTVRKGITFSFAVAAKKAEFELMDKNGIKRKIDIRANNLCQQTAQWLQKSLMELGVGGKTGVDYGYFGEPVIMVPCGGNP